MTKVLVLEANYSGYYGGELRELTLYPIDASGVLFEKLEDGVYSRAVSVGELEGKHSECYADLTITTVDLEDYKKTKGIKALGDLINKSELGYIEGFFEHGLESLYDCGNYSADKMADLQKKFGIGSTYPDFYGVYEAFITSLKEKYVEKFQNISVRSVDYESVVKLLQNNNVEFFD